jgi:hypothetical protein
MPVGRRFHQHGKPFTEKAPAECFFLVRAELAHPPRPLLLYVSRHVIR